MANLFLSGSAEYNSTLELFLTDQLLGMGSAITSNEGSLAWCEAYALAKCFASALNFVELMGNQLSPNSMSIFADRFAAIYGIATQGNGLVPTNLPQIQTYVGLKEAVFGTLPTYAAVDQYITILLGQVFIDLEYIDQHTQTLSTAAPLTAGQFWLSALSTLLIRVWLPRDNQDNLLMNQSNFINISNSYKAFVQDWLPADIAIRNLQLQYNGNDGYGSYVLVENVISGTAGGNTLTGISTAFVNDLSNVALGYQMPIEVVDDLNTLQTYHIINVGSNTSITTLEPIVNNITNRTYRLLGIQMDKPFVLDNSCFNV
jgi:hypothetical protein